jgi:glycosyltransferase involved in cell wall biosynthesis
MQLTIVVPLYNEEESLPELVAWIDRVLTTYPLTHEIIMIDDGSTDTSWMVIKQLKEKYPNVKGIRFRRNYGKSAALNTAFELAQGEVVITMDADLQDSPDEIPELYKLIKDEGYDIISGWKKNRHDPLTKTIPTKLYNWATRKMSGIKLHDMNCGLKSYSGEVVKNIEVYGEMHRYIPIIAKNVGFDKIGEKVVQHQARKYGVSKFGLSRFSRGLLDLMSITFMAKFSKRPMHFFGSVGLISGILGTLLLAILTVQKLCFDIPGIADRPLFFLGILLVIVGVQLFIAGFLAEMISRTTERRNEYGISETI